MSFKKIEKKEKQRNPSHLQYAVKYGYKTLLSLIGIVIIFILVKKFMPDSMIKVFEPLSHNAPLLFSVFFISEALLGLIFPDLFIMWAVAEPTPELYVLFLGVLSYFGGIVSFLIGKLIGDYRFFEKIVRNVRSKYAHQIQKFGGFFVVLAALTPIPFSPVSMLAGSMDFKFRSFLLYSLTRILRFLIYGVIFYYANNI